MIDLSLDLRDSPTLAAFFRSDAPVRLIVGPVGSGKSSVCVREILRRASEVPRNAEGKRRSRCCVVRNTYPELRDTTIRTFNEWIPAWLCEWKTTEHICVVRFNDVECEILFRSLDTPKDVKKLLSLELTFAYFNEWREIPQSIADMMETRLGRFPKKLDVGYYWTGMWGDTNPPDTDHYLYKRFEEERPEGYHVFKQPSGRGDRAENVGNLQMCPDLDREVRFLHATERITKSEAYQRLRGDSRLHLSPCACYYQRLVRGKAKDWIKVNADGEYGFVQEGMPIYPEFQDDMHVAKEPLSLLPGVRVLVIGQDYGLTPAAVWVQQDLRDGQYQVLRELVSTHLGAVRFGELMREISVKEFLSQSRKLAFRGWGDPSGDTDSSTDERTPIDVVTAAGVPTSGAPTNDFMLRREAVARKLTRLTVLGRPGLVIDRSCVTLRKAMSGAYCYERLEVSGPDRYRNVPLKNRYSHVAEALQYALVGEGEGYAVLDDGAPEVRRAVLASGEVVEFRPKYRRA